MPYVFFQSFIFDLLILTQYKRLDDPFGHDI